MNNWHQIPIVRLIIPFITGILIAMYLGYSRSLYFPFIILVVIYIVYIFFISKKISYKYRWISGILFNIILFCAGYNLLILSTPKFKENNIVNFLASKTIVTRVTEQVTEKENSYKIVSKIVAVSDSVNWHKVSGKIIMYFQKDSLCRKINYGDEILVSCQLSEIQKPQNPGEFNYKQYLANKGIYHQAYVKTGNWQIIEHTNGNLFKTWGIEIRKQFLEILQQNRLEGKEYAVVSAILLGYDEYLDSDQKQDFAAAGAMHILCVSGLHVGIISYILTMMLRFLKRGRFMNWIRLLLVLTALWIYASITGFSPSVLRATIMFSFINIGLSLKHRINIFNMLAASAFLLLIINPYIITEVGFQLSYLAVAGILLLYKPLYNLINSRYWLIDKFWQITVVSIAATLATFPLGIYYFHQFPKLFLLTNLIAIPASMLIIYVGILVLVFSPVKLISVIIGKILSYIIWFLNETVSWIESLSFATATGIYITRIELFLIFGIIVSIIIFILLKKKTFIFSLLSLLVILFIYHLSYQYIISGKSELTIYSIKNATNLDFKFNNRTISISDSSVILNPEKFSYHIANNRMQSYSDNVETFHINDTLIKYSGFVKQGNFIFFGGKTFIFPDDKMIINTSSEKFQVDYLIYTNNNAIPLKKLISVFNFKTLILDSSLPWWKADNLIEECRQNNVSFYNIRNEGAWSFQIN